MSKTITVETTINASLDEVWSEVSRIENHSNWMKAVSYTHLRAHET